MTSRRSAGADPARHAPTFDLRSGAVVGTAVVVGPDGSAGVDQLAVPEAIDLWAGVAREVAAGAPAQDGWWTSLRLPMALAGRRDRAEALLAVHRAAGVDPGRLVIEVGRWPSRAVPEIGLAGLLDAGARLVVDDDPAGLAPPVAGLPVVAVRLPAATAVDARAVAEAAARARALGLDLLVDGIGSPAGLRAAVDGGALLARGRWWGMPGPLAKVVATWRRPALRLSG